MLPLTHAQIRASFVNASKRELAELPLPDLDAIDFDQLDMLGWRDAKSPRRGYLVVPVGESLVGAILVQSEATARARAQCSLCQDVTLPNDVVFLAAKRAGAAGRKGDTVGTLVCARFECSANVRRLPTSAYIGFDVEAARLQRIESLRERAAGFARSILGE